MSINIDLGVRTMAMTKRDKKGLLISFCIIAAVAYIFPMLAMAEPSEHNYKIKQDDWEYTYRHREGAWHTEIGTKVGHRIEYRSFDNKEDHWRYRFIFEYTPHLYGPIHLYAKVQPRWAFKDGRTVVDHRDQLGLTWKGENWKITPFVERYALDGFEYRRTVYGTHFEYKL
jgi:hypothetical protein